MPDGRPFKRLDDVWDYYNREVIKLVNIEQILYYCSECRCQPDWIDKSVQDGRLIAYYGKCRTYDAWARWRDFTAKRGGQDRTCKSF